MWLLVFSTLLLLCIGLGDASQPTKLSGLQGQFTCPAPTFEWPKNSGYCWFERHSNVQQQGPGGNVPQSSTMRVDAETGELHVLFHLGKKANAVAGVFLDRPLGYGDYVWEIETSKDTVGASFVAVAFVHEGRSQGFNMTSAHNHSVDAGPAQYMIHPLQPSNQHPVALDQGCITHRLRWSGGDGPSHLHFESYSANGQLLASWSSENNDNTYPSDDVRVHVSFWMRKSAQPQQQQQDGKAQLVFSCFAFCPLEQEHSCSTPLGQKLDCQAPSGSYASSSSSNESTDVAITSSSSAGGPDEACCHSGAPAAAAAAAATTAVTTSTESGVAAAAAAARKPLAPPVRQVPACPGSSIEWPAGSRYCWVRRDTGGAQGGPGPNVFSSSNAVLGSDGQLTLRVVKSGQGKKSKSSCGDVYLDRSYGLGTYVFEVETNPSLVHPNLVGAALLYQDDQHAFHAIELSRWAAPQNQIAQYVIQPYQSNPPVRFNITQTRTTHRLRWTGSDKPSQLQFDSYTAGGQLLQSWTGTGGNNFSPSTERVHLSFWLFKDANDLPARSTLAFNCFRFCPLGQDAGCTNAAGTPSCQGPAQPVQPSPPLPSPSPPPVFPSPSPLPAPTKPPCPAGQFMWPANSDYCWYKRDSGGQRQGPGDNVFSWSNADVNAATGQLVVSVVKSPVDGSFSCGEVFLNRSLGFGDYVVVVATDSSQIHANLVASPFLYADNAPDGSPRELDIVELSTWGQPSIPNSQYVVQPHTSNPPHVFNLTGLGHTHRMRWSGSSSPGQVQFETYAADGALLQSWTNTGGNNFAPGPERLHVNHWISIPAADLPASSTFGLSCFRFCPLGQEAACSMPLGTKPSC